MNCKITLLVIALVGCLIGPSIAHGQSYAASILYPLAVPPGFMALQNTSLGSAESNSLGNSVGFAQFGPIVNQVETFHALSWTLSGVTDLNPSAATVSAAFASSGAQQAGYIDGPQTNNANHACFWSGSAQSVVDLNGSGLSGSIAYGTSGSQQAGLAGISPSGALTHAELWNGTASSAVDLTPTNLSIGTINYSLAAATDGTEQVGIVESQATNNDSIPVMWKGAAGSAVDLTPRQLGAITQGQAEGVCNGQQVGGVEGDATGGQTHAMLWRGTAASAVDLNPANLGFVFSNAVATNGYEQVGDGGNSNGPFNALAWTGTANSAVNLQALLPSTGTWYSSAADSIDAAGNIFGIAYSGSYGGYTGDFAVEWTPVPEPAAGSILLLVTTGFVMRLKRQQIRHSNRMRQVCGCKCIFRSRLRFILISPSMA